MTISGMPLEQAEATIEKLIQGIIDGSKRIEHILKRLKDFSRQDTGDPDQSIQINSVVDTSVEMLGGFIKKGPQNLPFNRLMSCPG